MASYFSASACDLTLCLSYFPTSCPGLIPQFGLISINFYFEFLHPSRVFQGGLRGTLLLLNSTSVKDMGNLTSSEMGDLKKAAEKAMKEDEEEADAGGKMEGEVTEEGVRLRIPLVRKKHPTELGKYGAKITFYTGEKPTKFIYYGNW